MSRGNKADHKRARREHERLTDKKHMPKPKALRKPFRRHSWQPKEY